MYKIIITDPAANDMTEAVSYISNELGNNFAALSLIEETQRIIGSLASMPARHPVVEDSVLASQGIRIVRIKNYLAFYVIREGTKSVTVLRFLYARRDWKNILKIK